MINIKITIITVAIISFLIGLAVQDRGVEAQIAEEKCEACEVCPTTLVDRVRGEINKHQKLKDAGFTDKDIEDIIDDKENILEITR